jgi:magnesium transporter
LTGIYGMNFDVMPELHWAHGYAYFWALALAFVTLVVLYFKRIGIYDNAKLAA